MVYFLKREEFKLKMEGVIMKAVVDKISGNIATLLVGPTELKVEIPKSLLPTNTKEGTWLEIDLKIDEKETQSRFAANKALLEKIKKKNKL